MNGLSVEAVIETAKVEKLKAGATLTLIAVLLACDDGMAQTTESYRMLAERTGIHFKTVKASLASLVEAGLVVVTKLHPTLNQITVIEPERYLKLRSKPRGKAA